MVRVDQAVIACALVAVAHAEPDKFSKAASDAFDAATAAEKDGKLDEALRLYEKANAISPNPSVTFNIAGVKRKRGDISGAIDAYKKYLTQAPDAKDRALVEKLIAELAAIPGTMELEIDEKDRRVFVDGKPTDKLSLELPAGQHSVDVITPISHRREMCQVFANSKRTCSMRLQARIDGNVVIGAPAHVSSASWSRSKGPRLSIGRRFQLAPGTYEIELPSGTSCDPISITVPPGDDILYVYLDQGPRPKTGCVKVTATQREIHF